MKLCRRNLRLIAFSLVHRRNRLQKLIQTKHFYIFPVIENLPQELRDRFTDMREMDLTVQSKC